MEITRRLMLGGLAASPTLRAMPERSAVDLQGTAIGLVRLQGSLDPQVISPWWYDAAVYGVIEGTAPLLMLRAEGCETYAMRREPGGRYRARGATVTAFKGVADGAWIDQPSVPTPLRQSPPEVYP